MNRRAWKVRRIASGVCLPLTILPIGLICSPFEPLRPAFKATFTVENRLPVAVSVTPIGAKGPHAKRMMLPLLKDSRLYFRLSKVTDYLIEPGATRGFVFDWDDINFSEIRVATPQQTKMLVLDPDPPRDAYDAPKTAHFEIDEASLVEPTPAVLAARPPRRPVVHYALLALGVVDPFGISCRDDSCEIRARRGQGQFRRHNKDRKTGPSCPMAPSSNRFDLMVHGTYS